MIKQHKNKEVMLFFALTLGMSFFIFWGPLAFFKIPAIGFASDKMGPPWAIALFIIGGFVPSIIGLILTAVFDGKKQMIALIKDGFNVKIKAKWYLLMLLTALILACFSIIIYILWGGEIEISGWVAAIPTIIPLFILGPVSEEFGWRGFALKRLMTVMNPNLASLIIGLFWSFWHLPLFYIIGTSQQTHGWPFLPFLIQVTSTSFMYTYFYIKTKENLFMAIFFHWMYTFFMDAAHSGVSGSVLYHYVDMLPAFLLGIIFILLIQKNKKSKRPISD